MSKRKRHYNLSDALNSESRSFGPYVPSFMEFAIIFFGFELDSFAQLTDSYFSVLKRLHRSNYEGETFDNFFDELIEKYKEKAMQAAIKDGATAESIVPILDFLVLEVVNLQSLTELVQKHNAAVDGLNACKFVGKSYDTYLDAVERKRKALVAEYYKVKHGDTNDT